MGPRTSACSPIKNDGPSKGDAERSDGNLNRKVRMGSARSRRGDSRTSDGRARISGAFMKNDGEDDEGSDDANDGSDIYESDWGTRIIRNLLQMIEMRFDGNGI